VSMARMRATCSAVMSSIREIAALPHCRRPGSGALASVSASLRFSPSSHRRHARSCLTRWPLHRTPGSVLATVWIPVTMTCAGVQSVLALTWALSRPPRLAGGPTAGRKWGRRQEGYPGARRRGWHSRRPPTADQAAPPHREPATRSLLGEVPGPAARGRHPCDCGSSGSTVGAGDHKWTGRTCPALERHRPTGARESGAEGRPGPRGRSCARTQ
jgi:hypothetical protein